VKNIQVWNGIRTHDLCDTGALIYVLLPSPRPSPLFPFFGSHAIISFFDPQPLGNASCYEMVENISTFSRLHEVLKEHSETNEELYSWINWKKAIYGFLTKQTLMKKLNFLKETDQHAHTIGRVKLTFQFAWII